MNFWNEANVSQSLCAQAIGWYVMNYIQECEVQEILRQVDSDAVRLIEEIKAIINDRTLDDPECFERVERLINAFYLHGISTSRHSEYE